MDILPPRETIYQVVESVLYSRKVRSVVLYGSRKTPSITTHSIFFFKNSGFWFRFTHVGPTY